MTPQVVTMPDAQLHAARRVRERRRELEEADAAPATMPAVNELAREFAARRLHLELVAYYETAERLAGREPWR